MRELTNDERLGLIKRVSILETHDVMSRVEATETHTFKHFGNLSKLANVDELVERALHARKEQTTRDSILKGRTAILASARRAELRNDVAFLVPGLLEYTFTLSHASSYVSPRRLTQKQVDTLNEFLDEPVDGRARRFRLIGVRSVDFGALVEHRTPWRIPTLSNVDAIFQLVDEFLTDGTLEDEAFLEYVADVQKRLFDTAYRLSKNEKAAAFSLPETRKDVVFFITR